MDGYLTIEQAAKVFRSAEKGERMATEVMPMDSASNASLAYRVGCNHTIKFSDLATDYAKLYDKWEKLTKEAENHRRSADTKAEEARSVQVELEKAASKLREHMVVDSGRPDRV